LKTKSEKKTKSNRKLFAVSIFFFFERPIVFYLAAQTKLKKPTKIKDKTTK
jgi:hypothetical protein